MRMVSTDTLKPGSLLGKTIMDKGQILLEKGTILTSRYIKRLKKIGIYKCYIKDEISQDIQLPKRLNDQLRIEAIETVGDLYGEVQDNHQVPIKKLKSIENLVDNLLNEILGEDELICDIMDLKTYDNYTFSHCVNVALLSVVTGISGGFDRETLYHLAVGGMLHDVGKMFLPISIVNKDRALTKEEFHLMKTHSEIGYNYLVKTGQINEDACQGVLQHHERVDGRGYPNGIYGRKISQFGKIYTICDVYDAITSDRPYRKAWNVNEGLEYVMANGNIRFDMRFIKYFLNSVVPYPTGTIVKLSNGFKAIVVENNKEVVNRPLIRVFEEENEPVKPYMIALNTDKTFFNVTIVATLNM